MAKILIVDDDVDLVNDMATVLREKGHECDTLYSTDNALQTLTDDTPDVLILDVMFPGNPAGGFDFARIVRQTEAIKDLPILMLTGVNQEFPMNFSAKDIDPEWMPVQIFVEKPVAPHTLLEKVDELLAAGKPHGSKTK